MRAPTRAALLLLSVMLLILTGAAFAQQDKAKEPPKGGPSQAEMEAMMKAMTPGEPQKQLARFAGDWTFTNRMWMAPGQPPAESTGTMHAEVLMGGRYVEHHWGGNMMGMAFEGRGTEAYDNVGKQYVNSWIDNMGTGIVHSIGSCDAGGKTCTYQGEMWDPATGKKTTLKTVITWSDDNTFKNEMYGPDPSGKEAKMMEITASRKK
jgi:hypothetical protein